MPDQQVREAPPVLARNEPHQVAFDLDRILLARESEPLREAAHVRVDDDPLRVAELRRDDVRGLARGPGQPHQLVDAARHATVELLNQHPHRAAQRPCLLAEETRREDVAFELLLRHREVVLRPRVLLEQLLRHAVHVHVRRLRGEHHRDEQLEVVAELQRDRCVLMLGGEPLDDRPDPLLLRTDALSRLVDVASCHAPNPA